jgi:hypothetical protein
MASQDKVIGGVLVAHGLLGIAWTYSTASKFGFPEMFLISNLALAAIGIASGVGCFVGRRWAALLGIFFLAVQLFHVLTPTFHFSFTLGLDLVISAGWYNWGQFGINLFALAMLVWLGARLSAPMSSFNRPRVSRAV